MCPTNTALLARLIFGLYDRQKFTPPKNAAAQQFLDACRVEFDVSHEGHSHSYEQMTQEISARAGGHWRKLNRGQEALICALDTITPTLPEDVVYTAIGVSSLLDLYAFGVVGTDGRQVTLTDDAKAWLVEDYLRGEER